MGPRFTEEANNFFINAQVHDRDTRKRYQEELKGYMVRYGWLSGKDSLYSYLDYNRERREYTHRWSPKAMGEMFGFREYDKLITLEAFLTTPINVLEDILEGVASGTERIKKLHDGHKGKKGVDPADLINAELNKLK